MPEKLQTCGHPVNRRSMGGLDSRAGSIGTEEKFPTTSTEGVASYGIDGARQSRNIEAELEDGRARERNEAALQSPPADIPTPTVARSGLLR